LANPASITVGNGATENAKATVMEQPRRRHRWTGAALHNIPICSYHEHIHPDNVQPHSYGATGEPNDYDGAVSGYGYGRVTRL
jgi:hypothetical protein